MKLKTVITITAVAATVSAAAKDVARYRKEQKQRRAEIEENAIRSKVALAEATIWIVTGKHGLELHECLSW